MSNHILELLGAYLDGELHGRQLQKAETHLDECQICQEEYASLQALSVVLGEVSTPEFSSPEQLAANVALQLPRKPTIQMRHKVLEVGWWLAPVGLIVMWIFISTTMLISDVISTANTLGLLDSVSAWMGAGSSSATSWSATLGQFGFLSGNNLQWAEITETFTRTTVPQIVWQVSIVTLYLSWIAIWWARHTSQGLGKSLKNGSKLTVKIDR